MSSKHSRICAEHFTEDSFQQNIAVRSFVATLSQVRGQLVLKKEAVPTIVTSLRKGASRNCTKNKPIMPAEQHAIPRTFIE